jgi:hypothetical protein
MSYSKDKKKRRVTVAILMVAALLLLFQQLFHDGVTAEAVALFFVFIALVTFFEIAITAACPPLSGCTYAFNRRPPPSHF